MKRYYVEGESLYTGEVIFGSAFQAKTALAATQQARVAYAETHDKSQLDRIDFIAREQAEYIPKF